ncbi:MAG: hypothetical protein ACK45U_08090, partial [bacterium]
DYVRPSLTIITSSKSSYNIDISKVVIPGHIDITNVKNSELAFDTSKVVLESIIKKITIDLLETNFYPNGGNKISFDYLKNRTQGSLTQNQLLDDKRSERGNEGQSESYSVMRKDIYNKFYYLILNDTKSELINNSEKKEANVTSDFMIIKLDKAYEFIVKHYQKMKSENKSFSDIEKYFSYSIILQGSVSGIKSQTKTSLGTKEKTTSELFAEAEQDLIDNTLEELTREVEDFQVITPVIDRKPISARIGSKEGLKIDNRYKVYDFTEADSTGKSKKIHIATVRVRSVSDNSILTDSTAPSKFYKIGGGRIDEGMLLQNKEDIGVGVSVGYGSLSWIRLDYRVKGITPGLKVFLGVNPYPGKVEFNKTEFEKYGVVGTLVNSGFVKLPKYTVLAFNAEVGVEKTMMLHSRFGITPFIAGGVSMINMLGEAFTYEYLGQSLVYNWDTEKSNIYTAYSALGGLRANLFLSNNILFFIFVILKFISN